MTSEPGRVLGRGRASVIYDLGDGTVLRRQLGAAATAQREGTVMRLAKDQGVPVPRVYEATERDLCLELVPGPTMMATLVQRPDRADELGRELAALHRRLDGVRSTTGRQFLVHGDLHPGNVIMSPRGPVLLDWTNARWADRALDVALTWLVLACFEDPAGPPELAVGSEPRGRLLESFLAAADSAPVRAALPRAAEIRGADPATTSAEAARMLTLCAAVG